MRNVYRVTVRVEPMPGCTEKAKDTVIVRECAVKKHEGYNQYAVVGSKDSYWSPVIAAAEEFGRVSSAGKVRIEFTPEPLPERVKWPWPDDLKRVRVGPAIAHSNVSSGFGRTISLLSVGLQYLGTVDMNALGVWPYNQSRIAENDNGFVKLSEVANGE